MPDRERRAGIFLAGANAPDNRRPQDGRTDARPAAMVACRGSYVVTFRKSLFGTPANGGVVGPTDGEGTTSGTAGCAHRGRSGTWRGWMWQAGGGPMAQAPGAQKCGGDVRLAASADPGSLGRVLAMQAGSNTDRPNEIGAVDRGAWNADFTCWAAGVIGAFHGLEWFRAHHRIPCRSTFPGPPRGGPRPAPVGRAVRGHGRRRFDDPFGRGTSGGRGLGAARGFRMVEFHRFEAKGLIAGNRLPDDTIGLMERMAHRRVRADGASDGTAAAQSPGAHIQSSASAIKSGTIAP